MALKNANCGIRKWTKDNKRYKFKREIQTCPTVYITAYLVLYKSCQETWPEIPRIIMATIQDLIKMQVGCDQIIMIQFELQSLKFHLSILGKI